MNTELQALFERQQHAFRLAPMPAWAERRHQLRALRQVVKSHSLEIAQAIDADFSAHSWHETWLTEVIPVLQHIDYTLRHLRRWMRSERRHVGLNFLPAQASVIYQPLGVVGIIVPFNYPLNLALVPLVTALAAGNRVMLKMSEQTPRLAALLASMLARVFAQEQVAVVCGDAETGAAFSRLPFDHLLFTGSTQIGKRVMAAAAENLTPVTLELGGKSPAIIADDIPLEDIIDRLCFAKSLNAGQTCVAPDYVLVPRAKQAAFVQLYSQTFRRMYPTLQGNPDYTSLINERSRQLLRSWLQDACEKGAQAVYLGDERDEADSFRMVPCLLTGVTEDMLVMQHELFGPLLPIIAYDDIDAALDYVRLHPRPLALYLFSYDKALQARVTLHTHAGTMCINEALIHLGVHDLPLGGIGPSGMGQYHGREGFLTFSNAKAVLSKGRLNGMQLIYPPYGGRIQRWLMRWLMR